MDVDGARTLCTFQVWHLVRLHGIRAFPRDSCRILIQRCHGRKTYIAVCMDAVELQNGLRISTPMHMTLYRGVLRRPIAEDVRDYIERNLLECLCTGSWPVVLAGMKVDPPDNPHRMLMIIHVHSRLHGRLLGVRNILFNKCNASSERRDNFHVSLDDFWVDEDFWEIVD